MKPGSEAQHQETLFRWAATQIRKYPELELLYHVPNGGRRDYNTARALKREGVKAGVPDLVLPVPRGGYAGAYIELKVGKNKPTKSQEWWLEKLKAQGYYVAVCYGWQRAADELERYLSGDMPREGSKAEDRGGC